MTPAQRRKDLLQLAVVVGIFGAAVLGLLSLSRSVARQNQAFDDRGVPVSVEITEVRDGIASYRYEVAGTRYEWSSKIGANEPGGPLAPGQKRAGRYLSEDPGRARLYPQDAEERARSEESLRGLAWILGATTLLMVFIRHVVRNGLSKRWVGLGITVLIMGAIIATNLDDKVAEVEAKAFGAQPLGLPLPWAVSLGELLLLGPALLMIFSELFVTFNATELTSRRVLIERIVFGHGVSAAQRSGRLRILAALGYLCLVFGAWIAFAAWRGI